MTGEEYFQQAEIDFKEKKYNQAIILYKKAAEQEYNKAQLRLGQCYLNGNGVEMNKELAFQYFKRAAKESFAEAEFLVALCYEKGYGVAANKQQAAIWYDLAAKHGDPDAKLSLKILDKLPSEIDRNIKDYQFKAEYQKNNKWPNYTNQYILDLIDKYITFVRGNNYFKQNRVKQLSWNDDRNIFSSIVSGTQNYNCKLFFKGNKLINHTCDCPAHYKYKGPCKHIIATMLEISYIRRKNLKSKEIKTKKEVIAEKLESQASATINIIANLDNNNSITKKTNINKNSTELIIDKEKTLQSSMQNNTDCGNCKNLQKKKSKNINAKTTQCKNKTQNKVVKDSINDKNVNNYKDDYSDENNQNKNVKVSYIFIGIIIAYIVLVVVSFFAGWHILLFLLLFIPILLFIIAKTN